MLLSSGRVSNLARRIAARMYFVSIAFHITNWQHGLIRQVLSEGYTLTKGSFEPANDIRPSRHGPAYFTARFYSHSPNVSSIVRQGRRPKTLRPGTCHR